MATLLTITASIITGIVAGGWLTMVIATAAMSRTQQHMQKKVRYWQDQARAWEEAGRRDLEAVVPTHWPAS